MWKQDISTYIYSHHILHELSRGAVFDRWGGGREEQSPA